MRIMIMREGNKMIRRQEDGNDERPIENFLS